MRRNPVSIWVIRGLILSEYAELITSDCIRFELFDQKDRLLQEYTAEELRALNPKPLTLNPEP